jgi:hypothetical protein
MSIDISDLGPLAVLAGEWEGETGLDAAPGDDRVSSADSAFRERIVFEPIGCVSNHDQVLHGLRYSLTAWRLGETDAFHQETGYWHWDPFARTVMRSFVVPRGYAVLAGGSAEPDAGEFALTAELGSRTFGICSNPFLDKEFQTVRFEMRVSILGPNVFSYDQDTVIRIRGREELFHHRDSNTLQRA